VSDQESSKFGVLMLQTDDDNVRYYYYYYRWYKQKKTIITKCKALRQARKYLLNQMATYSSRWQDTQQTTNLKAVQ